MKKYLIVSSILIAFIAISFNSPASIVHIDKQELIRQVGGNTLAGIVVISDGVSTAGYDPSVAHATARERKVRLFSVGVGGTEEPVNLQVAQKNDGKSGWITVAAPTYARVVSFDADLDYDDNYFDLLPGEERTIRWSAPFEPFEGEVPVTCWNQA